MWMQKRSIAPRTAPNMRSASASRWSVGEIVMVSRFRRLRQRSVMRARAVRERVCGDLGTAHARG